MCERCDEAKKLIQQWLDKQDHERCWYYPEIFNALTELYELHPIQHPVLPSRKEFEAGCQRYTDEQFDDLHH